MEIRKVRLEDLDCIVEIELENFFVEEVIFCFIFEVYL